MPSIIHIALEDLSSGHANLDSYHVTDGTYVTLTCHHICLLYSVTYVSSRGLMVRAGIMKRGLCTFVEKSRHAQKAGFQMALIINNENKMIDLPSIRENTDDLTVPTAGMKESDGKHDSMTV